MMSTSYQNIWAQIGLPITNGSAQIVTGLMAYVGPIFGAGVLAYLLIRLLIEAYTPNEATVLDFFKQIGLAAAIYTLISQQATFNYYVSGAVTGLTTRITAAIQGAFQGAGGAVTAATFDTLTDRSYALALLVYKQADWYDVSMGVVIGVYDIVTEGVIAAIFGIWFISSVSLSFIIAFGPLFIAGAFFPYTRRFFDGWVAAVVAAMLTQVFVLALLQLFLGIQTNLLTTTANAFTANAVDPGNSVPGIRNLCTSLGLTFVFFLLTGFALLLAKGISGGVAVSMPRVPIASYGRALASGGGGGGGPPGGGYRGPAGPAGPPGGGGSGSPIGAAAGLPPRQYAFNRTVGSAP